MSPDLIYCDHEATPLHVPARYQSASIARYYCPGPRHHELVSLSSFAGYSSSERMIEGRARSVGARLAPLLYR